MPEIAYETVLTQTIEIVSAISKQSVTEASNLATDLNLDSIGIAELVAELEDHFKIVIPMERLPELRTVRDVATSLVPLINGSDDLGTA